MRSFHVASLLNHITASMERNFRTILPLIASSSTRLEAPSSSQDLESPSKKRRRTTKVACNECRASKVAVGNQAFHSVEAYLTSCDLSAMATGHLVEDALVRGSNASTFPTTRKSRSAKLKPASLKKLKVDVDSMKTSSTACGLVQSWRRTRSSKSCAMAPVQRTLLLKMVTIHL